MGLLFFVPLLFTQSDPGVPISTALVRLREMNPCNRGFLAFPTKARVHGSLTWACFLYSGSLQQPANLTVLILTFYASQAL